MKTLKQWWAERSPAEVVSITNYCKWLDVDQPSGLVHKDVTDISKLTFLAENTDKAMLTHVLINAIFSKDKSGKYRMFDGASDEDRQNLLLHALTGYASDVNKGIAYPYLDTEHMLTYLDRDAIDDTGIERFLFEVLIKTEDKDNVDWEGLIYKCLFDEDKEYCRYHLPKELITLIPTDVVVKICKNTTSWFYEWDELPINSDIFDEVFFCQDDVRKASKKYIVDRLLRRANMSDTTGRKAVDDFLERVVSVNKRYLMCLYDYLDTTDFNVLYTRYKTEVDPVTGRMIVPDEKSKRVHFYGDEIRQFAMIAASCKRKRVFGGRIKGCGDAAGLLVMYHYDFEDIMNVLYPADPDNPCYFDMP